MVAYFFFRKKERYGKPLFYTDDLHYRTQKVGPMETFEFLQSN